MAYITDCLGAARVQNLFHGTGAIHAAECWGAGTVRRMRASVRERWLENERFPNVSGKGLPDGVDLSSQFRHGPRLHHSFHNSHVTGKECSCVRVKIGIGRDNRYLFQTVNFLKTKRQLPLPARSINEGGD